MRAMLVPGNQDAEVHFDIWYPWIAQEMRKLGLKVIAENMPDPFLARMEYWLPFIEEKLEGDPDSILIGHSSGATAALRYAETRSLLGMALVSACHTDLGDEKEKASHYFAAPWQWGKIKKNVKWILQLHSANDPFVPVEEGRFVAGQLGSEYHEFKDSGHFSVDVGKTEFPELLDLLKRKLGKR